MPDNDVARTVSVDYTIAAAEAFTHDRSPGDGRKFRFVYLSGGAAEKDQTKPLWFKQDYRRIRVWFLLVLRQASPSTFPVHGLG